MAAVIQRTFEAKPAVREAVGLLIGIVGPSSSGKTFSALRLAKGIQSAVGGEIDFIDTENGRALYYADKFRFNHVRFGSPFSPLDYLEVLKYVKGRGTKTVVVDSMSHEHEGPGGVLEWHEAEMDRRAKARNKDPEIYNMIAWAEPKAARRKLINELLQLNINVVMTFRAKEKIKVISGKDPKQLGWQPIGGEEFIYEMVLQCLLKPGCKGVPSWDSEYESERAMMKVPEQFEHLFAGEPQQISEALGSKLAEWAMGTASADPKIDKILADYAACTDTETLEKIKARHSEAWKSAPNTYKAKLRAALDEATKRIPPAREPGQEG